MSTKYKWFCGCHTAEEGKALYKSLVREHHPDNGGDTATMGSINDEFQRWWAEYKNIHAAADGAEYQKETSEDISGFMDILSKLARHKDITVDLCGSWLWISGNTYPVKDQLASYGCHWSKGHKKWFWAADVTRKTGKGHLSEKQITERHGRQRVTLKYNPQPELS